MKKILLLIGALMMTTCWFVSCDDNDGFSNPHILTNDELEEMERQRIQDSINRARINADIIVEYNITLSEGDAYEGKELVVDWQPIADCFGTTVETLWQALDDGDAKALFIQGSNHADYAGGTTANGVLGYWCNKDGDVCSWGSDAAVYEEWWSEDGAFFVGQMPGSLVAGDVVTIMPGVKYQDKRAIIKMTFTIGEVQKVEAGVVHEQNLTIDLGVGSGDKYQPTALAFDYDAVLAALGVSELSTDMLVTYDANGEFVTKQNADLGFWMSKDGPIGAWGEDASAWLSYGAIEEANVIGVCLMPGAQEEGDVFHNSIGFMNGDKIAMLNITINVVAGDAPQEINAEVVYTADLNIKLTVNPDSYNPSPLAFDYDAVLAAIGASELSPEMLVTYDADGGFVKDWNADSGFWMSKEGPIGNWGENASAWLSYGVTDPGTIGVCLMPGAHEAGDVFVNPIGFINEDKVAMLSVTIEVIDYTDPETKPGTEPADIAKDIELTKVWSDDYASVDVNVKDDICKAFNMTTFELYNALNDGTIKVFINEVAEEAAYTGSEPGEYWVNGEGATTDWAGGYFYTGLYIDYQNLVITIGAGNHPDNCPNPFSLGYKLIVTNGTTTATFNVTANFTAE